MFRFRGFKASLSFTSGKQSGIEQFDTSPGVSLTGAYRTNKDELFETFRYSDPPKTHQTITPSMVKLPSPQARRSTPVVKSSRSTNDLNAGTQSVNIRNSAPNMAQTSNNSQITKNQIKEQKKLEKMRLTEQKKQERLLIKERQKEERLKKEREKQARQREIQEKNKNAKKTPKRNVRQPKPGEPQTTKVQAPLPTTQAPAPPPTTRTLAPPPTTRALASPPTTQALALPPTQYSTNTLESSISRSSGPPPYEVVPNKSDNTGNTSFVNPDKDSEGSWDLISQHRQQISRPMVAKSIPKQTHLDLNYNNVRTSKTNDNSEA